jgi:hypothetical protein
VAKNGAQDIGAKKILREYGASCVLRGGMRRCSVSIGRSARRLNRGRMVPVGRRCAGRVTIRRRNKTHNLRGFS